MEACAVYLTMFQNPVGAASNNMNPNGWWDVYKPLYNPRFGKSPGRGWEGGMGGVGERH